MVPGWVPPSGGGDELSLPPHATMVIAAAATSASLVVVNMSELPSRGLLAVDPSPGVGPVTAS
jgi:hypothetical protein